ncbi:MAG: undecaprenyl-diphosphate phosphatase [Candidatus Nanohaloarchaea archaeon]
MSLAQAVILGVLQGVFEWLPVSSEAVISIVMTQVFGAGVTESLNSAIWLHTGTMLAALIYFRKDFSEMLDFSFERLKNRNFEIEETETGKVFAFLLVATVFTSAVGGAIYLGVLQFLNSRPDLFAGLTGAALLATGLLRFYQGGDERNPKNLDLIDSSLVGVLQGMAVIPGVSRSGSTVFGLLYRNFSGREAFRLSFLLSVPAILIANIGINILSGFTAGTEMIVAAGVAFVVGYLSIDIVLKIAEKTAVAYLCFILAMFSFVPVFL